MPFDVFDRMAAPPAPHMQMYRTEHTVERTAAAGDHRYGPFRTGITAGDPFGVTARVQVKVRLHIDKVIGGEREEIQLDYPLPHRIFAAPGGSTGNRGGVFACGVSAGDLQHRQLPL